MIVEKRFPALARWPSRFRHVLCRRGLADINPELEQFTMDTGHTPERVCNAHLANKLTNLSWGSWPTAPGSRFQAPVSPKSRHDATAVSGLTICSASKMLGTR